MHSPPPAPCIVDVYRARYLLWKWAISRPSMPRGNACWAHPSAPALIPVLPMRWPESRLPKQPDARGVPCFLAVPAAEVYPGTESVARRLGCTQRLATAQPALDMTGSDFGMLREAALRQVARSFQQVDVAFQVGEAQHR